MHTAAIAIGALLVLIVLLDTFETIVLPRGITRTIRFTRLFYRTAWALCRSVARRLRDHRRETFLSFFGPLSLPALIGVWAIILILGFAMVQWGIGSHFSAPERHPGFPSALYVSGTTFFTLGLGDVTPTTGPARALLVLEGGMGFGFLAIVIGYLPVLYQSFSRREVSISLLDARAGSPPTAGELLRRLGAAGEMGSLGALLREWEQWAADLLESHLSYPVLTYYRSQHDRQSWLAAMTALLDASALVMAGIEGTSPYQARLTFAMARHAIVDLSLILMAGPVPCAPERLPPDERERLVARLGEAGVRVREGEGAEARLRELRGLYEPYLCSLAQRLLFDLPPFILDDQMDDDWEASAWEESHL